MSVICLYLNEIHAKEQPTNHLNLEYFLSSVRLENPQKGTMVIVTNNLAIAGARNYLDKFGDLTMFNNVRLNFRLHYDRFDYFNMKGTDLFRDIISDTAKESAVDILPLEVWENGPVATFFTKLFAGSVGNTDEERLDPVSEVPTVSELTLEDEHAPSIEYGYRVFRTEPYLYLQNRWGWMHKKHLLITEVKFASLLDNLDQIGIMNIRGLASLYVVDDIRLVGGASFYPTELSSDRWSPTYIMRIEHHMPGRAWYAGFWWTRYETLVSAGVTVEWDTFFRYSHP